jgi:aryl-alcohol dehydrogenase-like predicted oxidoreductase
VIDLYQLHEPDPAVPIADTLGALDRLVAEGKVREIGCSNFTVPQLREAAGVATRAHFASVQNEYSLLHRTPEHDGVLDECVRAGLAFLPYFPLADGLLTGSTAPGRPLPEGARLSEGTGRAPGASRRRTWRGWSGWWRSPRGTGARRSSWRSPGCWRGRRWRR